MNRRRSAQRAQRNDYFLCALCALRRLTVFHPAYNAPSSHGPQIANVIPGVWMLANKVSPSGLKVAPANSDPVKPGTVFIANLKISPRCVNPCRNSSLLPSSQRINPPPGVPQMLSGLSRTPAPGDSKISVNTPPEAPRDRYCHTCPRPALPPLVELKNTLPSPYQAPSSLVKIAPPPAKPCLNTASESASAFTGSGSSISTQATRKVLNGVCPVLVS